MDKKELKRIKIEVEVPTPPGLTKEQIADLKQRLKCAMVLSYPERLRHEQIVVQNHFRR